MYWQLTPRETGELLDVLIERESRQERNAMLRAGLVAAEIRNSYRSKRSDRVWTAWDFLGKKQASDAVIESPSAFRARMRAFAEAHNKRIKYQEPN